MFLSISSFLNMWLIGGSLTNILLYRIESFFVLIFVLTCSCFVIKQPCKRIIIKVATLINLVKTSQCKSKEREDHFFSFWDQPGIKLKTDIDERERETERDHLKTSFLFHLHSRKFIFNLTNPE